MSLDKNPYRWHYRHYAPRELLGMAAAAGLQSISWAGADCNLINASGRVVQNNFYSVAEAPLRAHYAGQTVTYIFAKPPAL